MSEFNSIKFQEELAGFTGTELLYRTIFPHIVYSEGVKFVAEKCKSYWLIDVIVSYQTKEFIVANPFQVWSIKVTGKNAVVSCTDGNDNILVTQKIESTDFPLKEFKFFLSNFTLILPGEY